jgi:arylsulfatase A-like enzyme
MFIHYLKVGLVCGGLYGLAVLLFEDLWAWTVLRLDFTLKQVGISVLLYALIFAGLGLISGIITAFVHRKGRLKELPAMGTVILLIAINTYFLLSFKPVVAFVIRASRGMIPQAIPIPIIVLFLAVLWFVFLVLASYMIIKILARISSKNPGMFRIAGIAAGSAILIYFILTKKTNSDFFKTDAYSAIAIYWQLLLIVITGASFFCVLFFEKLRIAVRFSGCRTGNARNLLLSLIALISLWTLSAFLANRQSAVKAEGIQTSGARLPNIVFLLIDTLRADHMSVYGYERETTPRIDEFSKNGVVFSHAIAQSSWTKPSVCSIFTSRYTLMNGVQTFEDVVPMELVSFAEVLQEAGYFGMGISTNAQVEEESNYGQGFHEFRYMHEIGHPQIFSPMNFLPANHPLLSEILYQVDLNSAPYATARQVHNQAIPWLKNYRNQQFFIYLHYMEPHAPYIPRRKYYSEAFRFTPEANYASPVDYESIPNPERYYRDIIVPSIDRYDDEIRNIDFQLGILFEKMDELDLWNNSIVVLTSDHGEEFFEHNSTRHGPKLFEEIIHVPLIIWFPEGEYGGATIEPTVELIDIVPTLFHYLGVGASDFGEGKTLLPMIQGAYDYYSEEDRYHFSDVTWEPGAVLQDAHAVLYDEYKLIRTLKKRPELRIEEDLFNFLEDPGEKIDYSTENGTIFNTLRENLEWHIHNCDSLAVQPLDTEKLRLSREDLERLRALGYVN